jgi:hypothetical protein
LAVVVAIKKALEGQHKYTHTMNERMANDDGDEEKMESVTVREYLERLASAARQLAISRDICGEDCMKTRLVDSTLES